MAHVLIVEDDQADRTILGSILEGLGHKVYFATDGKHALKIYVKNRIDVVVTDLQMPYVDGLELIMTLRALFPEVAVIAVSGKGPELLAEARSQGVHAALPKPVDPHALLEAVAQAAVARPAPATRASKLQRLKILDELAS